MTGQSRYYYESDGGDTWTGHYWSRRPKTYYVCDHKTDERIDCDTAKEAADVAWALQMGRITWDDAKNK